MKRAAIAIVFCVSVTPAKSQLPPNFDKRDYFGDMLALTAFCGLAHNVDQYEMGQAMKAFGVTSVDRQAIEVAREKHYQAYRDKFKTSSTHGDFCIAIRSHPFFSKVSRNGTPVHVGSDTKKQEEKTELFGHFLGAMAFCKIPFDAEKWWSYMFDMGVKSETVPALTAHSNKVRQDLLSAYGTPDQAAVVCDQVRTNPAAHRFTKR